MMIYNIHGKSGTGKTTFIIKSMRSGGFFLGREYIKLDCNWSYSMLPLPEFSGSILDHLSYFELDLIKFDRLNKLLLNLDYKNRNYSSLSMGERRRLEICRIVSQSNKIVIDEPFANVGLDLVEPILKVLSSAEVVIMLTHEPINSVNIINVPIENLL